MISEVAHCTTAANTESFKDTWVYHIFLCLYKHLSDYGLQLLLKMKTEVQYNISKYCIATQAK